VKLGNTDTALRRGWHVVATSDEIGRDPVQVWLLGEPWVLVRLPAAGSGADGATRLVAFEDRCPHRLAPLSAGTVVGETLQCGYHGWCFDAEGACTAIPAIGGSDRIPPRARVAAPAALAEAGGLVFLAPDAPVGDRLDLPYANVDGFLHHHLVPARARVGAGLMLDNFLDLAHFPFVHAATIGTADALEVPELVVERDGLGMVVTSTHWFPNHEDPGVTQGIRPLLQQRSLRYDYRAPFQASLRIDYVQAGGTNVLDFFVQPESAEQCRIYTVLHRDDLDDAEQLADAGAYEQKILDEDLHLQEQYVDRSLPLDITAEVHVRTDRPGVELRRILADFVAAATTSQAHPGAS
jgi:phenylpropionate dioxygenase-like ring-hydroxylating dioxygenase large terminal subunit